MQIYVPTFTENVPSYTPTLMQSVLIYVPTFMENVLIHKQLEPDQVPRRVQQDKGQGHGQQKAGHHGLQRVLEATRALVDQRVLEATLSVERLRNGHQGRQDQRHDDEGGQHQGRQGVHESHHHENVLELGHGHAERDLGLSVPENRVGPEREAVKEDGEEDDGGDGG